MTDGLWPAAGLAEKAGPSDGDTAERLLDATERLMKQIGIGKTSMADVARAANVSRGTLYRYFDSRETLLDALSQRTTDRFFADAAAAMDASTGLAEQVGKFSETMIRALHPGPDQFGNSRTAMIRMLITQSPQALRRTSKFLRPYIQAALERGEVRTDLDVDDASEWLARMLLSFTVFQTSIAYEADDPESVSSFVQRYAIDGLTGA
ncbi:TetR/AcrR family transcriptional regulator [Cryptosporangium minutisporangium]|uniref:TetR/AcrR family transcriptional regulator n=1 Tax=Cryptosporangium minutisporangium TaxID=113569 RepID=A0ABP6T0R8_9ACTN